MKRMQRFTDAGKGELNGQKLHANTWMPGVTAHGPDCRGRLGQSPEAVSTGYLHPVFTALSTLVWTADNVPSFPHYSWAPPMQKQENTNKYLQDQYTAFITCFSASIAMEQCIMFNKNKTPKRHNTDIIHSFIRQEWMQHSPPLPRTAEGSLY